MTLSIPDDWQRSEEEYAEAEEEFLAAFTEEERQAVHFDAYGDESEDFTIALITMDMVEMSELGGLGWTGWEEAMETYDITKEDYLASFGSVVFGELTQTSSVPHTIHGKEAVEGQFEGMVEGVLSVVNVLLVFPENDLGWVMLLVEETSAVEFEDIWETIRDSVEFQE